MQKINPINYKFNPYGTSNFYDDSFSQYETLLKLLELINQLIETMTEGSDEIEELRNNKVSIEDMISKYKLDSNGNFTGSWWGIEKPVHVEGGIDAVVIEIQGILNNLIINVQSRSENILFYPDLIDGNNITEVLVYLNNLGKDIFIPEGVWYCEAEKIDWHGGNYITGVGYKTVLKCSTNGQWFIRHNKGATNQGGIISNLTIDGDRKVYNVIKMEFSFRQSIFKCMIKNAIEKVIDIASGTTNCWQLTIMDCELWGIDNNLFDYNLRPLYSFYAGSRFTDSIVANIVSMNAVETEFYVSSGLVAYSNIHSYGYPSMYESKDSFLIDQNASYNMFQACYADSAKESGYHIKGVGNSYIGCNVLYNKTDYSNYKPFKLDKTSNSWNADHTTIIGCSTRITDNLANLTEDIAIVGGSFNNTMQFFGNSGQTTSKISRMQLKTITSDTTIEGNATFEKNVNMKSDNSDTESQIIHDLIMNSKNTRVTIRQVNITTAGTYVPNSLVGDRMLMIYLSDVTNSQAIGALYITKDGLFFNGSQSPTSATSSNKINRMVENTSSPSGAPSSVGLYWLNTTTKNLYVSVGTSVGDWKQINLT